MTPEEVGRLLATGWVDGSDLPEMQDDDFRSDVAKRAEALGLSLFYSHHNDTYGLVLDGELPEVESHHAAVRLDRADRAVIAVCWMHLRWLPAEQSQAGGNIKALTDDEPSMTLEELAEQFRGQLNKTKLEKMVLPQLKRLGYLQQRGGRLYGGPMLDSLDEAKATEMARQAMFRYKRMAHLRHRAEQIEAVRRAAEEAQRC